MKILSLSLLLVGIFTSSSIAGEMKLVSEMDKVSHIIGNQMGGNLKNVKDLNMEVLIQSLKDAYAGKELQLKRSEAQQIMMGFQRRMRESQMAERNQAGMKNKVEGEKYLKANAKKEGVKTTDSGLQYKVIKAGTGKMPKSSDTVKVHYHGTLIDGTVFDSSYDRGEPISFPVTGVIKGWVEALQMMKVGAIWELVIPSEIAYGANPRPGGKIGPNAVLKFKVELIAIQ